MQIKIDQYISLEQTNEQHADAMFSAIDSNRNHLSEYLPWVNTTKTAEDTRAYIQSSVALINQGLESSFMIFYESQLVGRIGLHHINLYNKSAAIGYWLSKNAEGRGIVSNSCITMINYGFAELNLHRIEIKAATQNLKSQAIPEKLRFHKEGILREAELVNERYLDLVLYSMLYQDWQAVI